MAKYLLIGSNGTLGVEFKHIINSADLIIGDRADIDVTNFEKTRAFLERHTPEVVINCTGYTKVDGVENDYDAAMLLNGTALKNLSEVCNDINAALVHFSTGMVFSGTKETGYNEDDKPSPINRYGLTKLEGEMHIQEICRKYYIIRTEWLYGKPRTETAKKSFVEIMIELAESGTVRGVIDEIGKPTWAKDLAQASMALIESGKPYGIYHLANEGQTSRADWAKEIYKLKNIGVNVEPVSGSEFPRPAPRPHYELLNNTKLPKLRPWQEALKEYLSS